MFTKSDIEKHLCETSDLPLIDVRTPAEFSDGHIPGAHNLPLFTNEERAEVGTLYKKKGPDEAINLGLGFVGPKMQSIAESAKNIAVNGSLLVHCWRGGKRSESIAWLLDFSGLQVAIINGGYKAYRRYALEFMANTEFNLTILGGRTGSAKTAILHKLSMLGEQVVDLEGLANHKGSAFGWIGEEEQPTTQQFENELFEILRHFDPKRRIWVENESKSIGRVYIPDGFWNKMKNAPLVHLEVSLEQRVNHLVSLYAAQEDRSSLAQSFTKIERRLGGKNLKAAVDAIEVGDYAEAARIALVYYDKTYDYNLENNRAPFINVLNADHLVPEEIALRLCDLVLKKEEELK
jgi:tRNA 2-selenouridine synthase